MNVLATILGRGMSSRLFTKMRDELGICYYVRAYHNPSTDHGSFDIAAGVDTTRVELAIKTILEEVKRLTTELVPKDELKKAKDYIAGTMMLGLETSDAQAEFMGHQEILRRVLKTPEMAIAQIQKVTAKDIQKLAQEFFIDKNLNMAIIGPYKDEHRFDKILTLGK
jgi:predicted Zn-dependent peptidase